jgi:hypothetical protein
MFSRGAEFTSRALFGFILGLGQATDFRYSRQSEKQLTATSNALEAFEADPSSGQKPALCRDDNWNRNSGRKKARRNGVCVAFFLAWGDAHCKLKLCLQ